MTRFAPGYTRANLARLMRSQTGRLASNMKLEQRVREHGGWTTVGERRCTIPAQLVLVFGSTATLCEPETWSDLVASDPGARIVGCSTAGEITGGRVIDDSLVATSLALEHGQVAVVSAALGEREHSKDLGRLLGSRLAKQGLVHVLVFSDGIKVNGSELVAGITQELGVGVAVTGGLAGDGSRFERTAVCLDGPSPSEQVVAVGLYGDRLRIGYGSLGGWDPFGVERTITKSRGNVLIELDGEPALDLYKRYLGEHASDLPSSGLLFPLTIRGDDSGTAVVRTILAVDEQERTLTFAGDMPRGHRARLMRANFERLVDGASGAARTSMEALGDGPAELAILISCVGRKLVLKQRIEEEVEAVVAVVGPSAVTAGFYSYGEIAPFISSARCELHNQTMTVTTISER
jgi:hypothetical protein